jgi:pyruvate kinase
MKIALFLTYALSTAAFVPTTFQSRQRASFLSSTVAPNGDTTTAMPFETSVAGAPKVAQRWRKSTKQVITLGPASESMEMIEKLFLAGADVFRLNFSHGSQEQKKELLITIREIEEKYSHPIGILGDLQGPKLRVSCNTTMLH